MRIARFAVTPELLRQLLRLPVTSEIVWAGMDERGSIELTVRDPALREVTLREGERPPVVCPLMHEIHIELTADDLPLELAVLGRYPSMVITDWRQA